MSCFGLFPVSSRINRWWLLLVVVLGVLGAFWAGQVSSAAAAEIPPKMIPASFADVAAKASPAVVNISSERVVKPPDKSFRFDGRRGPTDPFNEFFDRFFGGEGQRRERKERSLGSGFIIDRSGLIITNNHVVEDAKDIKVKMSDGKDLPAEVLGRDPKTDVALLRIKAGADLPYLELGDSSKVKVGDWVIAIGNPFGLEHTVTAGILSGRGRAIGAGPYDDFLQTDASINPGNSGGPLLNLLGEVVGINTAIVAGGTGIGFAIPTSLAKNIVAQLKDRGKVVRGWLGVIIHKITPELAKSLKLKGETGALVADVTSGGPADKAGLKRYDVIIEFNGKPVKDFSELPAMVADTPVGSQAKVLVIRDEAEKTFTVQIGELKDEEQAKAVAPMESPDLGLTVRELTPEIAQKLGIDEATGVVIWSVVEGSPAEETGLKPMDLILEINRVAVKNMSEYKRIIAGTKKGETVLFLVKRKTTTLFFTLDVK